MTNQEDLALTNLGDKAHRFVRRRLVAEETQKAAQAARAQALLRTVTAMAAFVVAGWAFLLNAGVEMSQLSKILVAATFIALGGALVLASMALAPRDAARPETVRLKSLIERTEEASAGEHDKLARDIATYEANLLEESASTNDRVGRLLLLAFYAEVAAAFGLLAGFFVVLPSL